MVFLFCFTFANFIILYLSPVTLYANYFLQEEKNQFTCPKLKKPSNLPRAYKGICTLYDFDLYCP